MSIQDRKEALVVNGLEQMGHLVYDHVLQQVLGLLDQLSVEADVILRPWVLSAASVTTSRITTARAATRRLAFRVSTADQIVNQPGDFLLIRLEVVRMRSDAETRLGLC